MNVSTKFEEGWSMRFRVIKNEKLTKRQTDGPTVQPTWAMHYFY